MPASAPRVVDWYDLPRYYDLAFAAGTQREAAFLEAAAAHFGRAKGRAARRVLEPACGSGRLVRALCHRGWQAAGFDANPHMLAHALARAPAAGEALWRDRMQSFVLPEGAGPFGLAHCLVDSFRYLLSERAARSCLRRVAASLAPGGIFVLGLHLCRYDRAGPTRELWRAADGPLEVVCDVRGAKPDPHRRRERTSARVAVRGGRRQPWRRTESTWDFRTYSAAELARLVAAVPTLEHLATFGFAYDLDRPQALEGPRRDAVLVLRRRPGRRLVISAATPGRPC